MYDRSSILRRALLRIASLILVILAGLSPLRADSDASGDDRSTALWVIRKGGRVLVDRQAEYISDAFDLPDGTIRIIGVDMHGTLADPKDLEPLRKLRELRDLNLPARVWTPASGIKSPYSEEMFDYLAAPKRC